MRLAACTRVGARPEVDAAPFIVCNGEITVGDDFVLRSRPVQSHIVANTGARICIGNRVTIAAGAALSSHKLIEIGDDATLGAFCMIMDSDFHVAGNSEAAPEPKPIHIGEGARLGHRVVVLPGTRIGPGAIVAPGSVVSGDVPGGVTVEGNPARVHFAIADAAGGDAVDAVPALVKAVLNLAEMPGPDDGPDQVAEWDSLGALRLVLALEERFEITLTEDEIRGVCSIRDIEKVVSDAQRRAAPGV
jgi:acetyltransferase-like isoleucine patch superfamily enzyme/acyl carrier protein